MLLSFKWLLVRFSVVLIIVTIYVSGNMYGRFLHITFLKTIWTIKNIYFLVYKSFVTISILYCILKLIWLESVFFADQFQSSFMSPCSLPLYSFIEIELWRSFFEPLWFNKFWPLLYFCIFVDSSALLHANTLSA